MDRIPDLTLSLRDYGFVSVLNGRETVVTRSNIVGTHHPDGVFLGIGPGIRAGAEVGNLSILDVAPALLHSLGLEIPTQMEGAFPSSMYEPEYLEHDAPRVASELVPAPAVNVTSDDVQNDNIDEESEAILMDRLRSLGYVQ